MALCRDTTSESVTRCIEPKGHGGGHRGVLITTDTDGISVEVVLTWSEEGADPIMVGVTR